MADERYTHKGWMSPSMHAEANQEAGGEFPLMVYREDGQSLVVHSAEALDAAKADGYDEHASRKAAKAAAAVAAK